MNIIFDEVMYCEDLLKNRPKIIKNRYLYVLLKYFYYSGLKKLDAIDKIKEFCRLCEPNYNFTLAENVFINLEKVYGKQKIKIPKKVGITKQELESIRVCNDYKKEKILFVLLVLSKNNHATSNKYYVNDVKDSTLFRLAKVYLNKIDRDKMMHELYLDKYFSKPRDDQQNFLINYVDTSEEYEIIVTDMNNIIYFYPIYCEKCGKRIDKVSEKKKLCDECYKEKRKEDWNNSRKELYKKNGRTKTRKDNGRINY